MAKRTKPDLEVVEVAEGVTPTVPLPKDLGAWPEILPNPEIGKPGHFCLDPQNRYRKNWSSIYIHKNTQMPTRQSFLDENANPLRVMTGMWVDVPPCVVQTVQECNYEELSMSTKSDATGLATNMERVTKMTPRFQFSVVPSA